MSNENKAVIIARVSSKRQEDEEFGRHYGSGFFVKAASYHLRRNCILLLALMHAFRLRFRVETQQLLDTANT